MNAEKDRATLRELLTRTSDPEVHARVWDHLEGRISRHDLYRDPAFARAMGAWYAEEIERARKGGFDPAQLRTAYEEYRASEEFQREMEADGVADGWRASRH